MKFLAIALAAAILHSLSAAMGVDSLHSVQSAVSQTLPSTFTTTVKEACKVIRDADSMETVAVNKQELLAFLESVNPTTLSTSDQQLYVRTAYGLFLSDSNLNARASELQKLKQLATPVVLNENLICVPTPQGKLVVLEKLTPENKKAWEEYAHNEWYPYQRVRNFSDMKEEMRDGPEKEALMWMEFRPDVSGIMYFHSRIKAGIIDGYDKWIAYVYSALPDTLLSERANPAVIKPDHIEMVMTIQASKKHDTYSPMGISRTVAAAKQMFADKKVGKTEARIEPSLAIWFHALTCKIVQTKYENITKFWTKPVPHMRRILTKALLPDERLPSVREPYSVWARLVSAETGIKIAQKIAENRFPGLPWSNEFEFQVNTSAEIKAEDLLATILP